MRWMTEDATVACAHDTGTVTGFDPAQSWVTVNGRRVLVEPDPVGRTIVRCNNLPPQGVPCTATLAVEQGYSTFAQVDGRRICLDTVRGLTNGVAPVDYTVRDPAQRLVDADA
jgi:hypothetical protein